MVAKNVAYKMTLHSLKHQHDYSSSLTSSNIDKSPGVEFVRTICIQLYSERERKVCGCLFPFSMKPEICRAMTANKYTKKCDDMDAYNSLIPYLGK